MLCPRLLQSIIRGNGGLKTVLTRSQAKLNSPKFSGLFIMQQNYSCVLHKSDTNSPNHSGYGKNLQTINLLSRRLKKTKGRSKATDDDDDDKEEEEDEDDGDEENPLLMEDGGDANDGGVLSDVVVNSLRLDTVGKIAFSTTRQKIEESFYKGLLYINGVRAEKKSQDLSLSDEIDFIKHPDADDPNLVHVKRCQIVSLPDKASEQGRLKIKLKIWQNLIIDAPSSEE